MKYDQYQQEVITSNQNLLVIAGPGSGKTTTILEKVKYLCKTEDVKDILLLSFTNKSVNDIKERLNLNIKVMTFHSLATDILKHYQYPFRIINNHLLSYIIDEYFAILDIKEKKKLYNYLNVIKLNKNSQEYKSLKKLIISFINLFKTNNHDFNLLKKIIKDSKEKLLLKIILDIFLVYEKEKKSCGMLDFDDLIIKATALLKNNYHYCHFKYLIIDEFQDTSEIRLNLIKEIYQHSNAIITAVGDDAQSIFHFSGCDLNIFLNFSKYFDNSKIVYLRNTYRNSQELINISSTFIEKNPLQLKKMMISNKHEKNPIIIKRYYSASKTLTKVLKEILLVSSDIMILGRNNNDIYKYLNKDITFDGNFVYFQNQKIKYLTIHSSKGLESDYVIILNVSNSLYGIPNKIEDHPIISFINNKEKEIPFAEERRVFFVALTRCKYQTYLLVPRNNPSPFIKEIK